MVEIKILLNWSRLLSDGVNWLHNVAARRLWFIGDVCEVMWVERVFKKWLEVTNKLTQPLNVERSSNVPTITGEQYSVGPFTTTNLRIISGARIAAVVACPVWSVCVTAKALFTRLGSSEWILLLKVNKRYEKHTCKPPGLRVLQKYSWVCGNTCYARGFRKLRVIGVRDAWSRYDTADSQGHFQVEQLGIRIEQFFSWFTQNQIQLLTACVRLQPDRTTDHW